MTWKFKRGFSLAGRGEYISSSGRPAQGTANFMYGPGRCSVVGNADSGLSDWQVLHFGRCLAYRGE